MQKFLVLLAVVFLSSCSSKFIRAMNGDITYPELTGESPRQSDAAWARKFRSEFAQEDARRKAQGLPALKDVKPDPDPIAIIIVTEPNQ